MRRYSRGTLLSIIAMLGFYAAAPTYAADTPPATPPAAPPAAPAPADGGTPKDPSAEGEAAADKDPVKKACGNRQPPGDDDEAKALEQAKQAAYGVLTNTGGVVAKAGICYINQLVADNRVDQETVYGFVRQVRASLEGLDDYGAGTKTNDKIVFELIEINKLLDGMRNRSYEDWLFQNGNLSHQIQKRLPGLVTDAATLTVRARGVAPAEDKKSDDTEKKDAAEKPAAAPKTKGSEKPAAADKKKTGTKAGAAAPAAAGETKDVKTEDAAPPKPVAPELVADRLLYFREDLELLATRYFDSRRILAGVGIGYSYLPRVKYAGRTSIDVSDVLPEAPGGRDQIRYGSQFADQGYASLIFTAKMRTALVDLSLQNLEETQTSQTPVFVRPFNATEDLLGRSTIKTKLTSNYDVNLRFSIKELINVVFETANKKAIERGQATEKDLKHFKSRDDFEIGMGLTGFGIEDSVSTDFRRRANPGLTYSELTPFSVKDTKTENNFNAVYFIVGYRIDLTDQASVAVSSRRYINAAQRFDRASIEDFALTISATYYPLF